MDIVALNAQGEILADVFNVDIQEVEEVALRQFSNLEPTNGSGFYVSELELSPQNNPYLPIAKASVYRCAAANQRTTLWNTQFLKCEASP